MSLRSWYVSVLLRAIASKPKVHLALSAHMNLELAYDLFDAALYEAQRRIKILAELNKLLDQARLALNITQSLLDDAQKLARPKYARTEDSNHNPNPSHPQEWQNPPEWPADVPSHHYHSTTAGQSSTLNLPRTEQYPGEQHSLYTPYQTQLLTQQFSDSFFEHPQMVYNPISGYQYHDYQGAEYFQQQMESGYDASGEDVMPMLEDSWQTFMNHIRQ
ncbi:hypothetical protein BT96DRAFT_950900 [Gymnopus androsaceus JB14]|uniref:Uncharacterized protein n=1 Tax=Gymnopus androsaceus JB14 TaxID=1447944 RepID=A0A6A4GEV3_9AGAR|nr:hypothetical protein BT96DRAFT_950900 [Gymnopus androsaceus JB14]